MAKSTKLAYGFWCLGGLFGLHHVYLGRDKQGLVWLGTFGGFLFGLVRDLFKMPEYVREADQNENLLAKIKKERSKLLAPSPFSLRFLSAVAFSAIYGYFMINCLPDELEESLAVQLASLIKLTYPLVIAIFVQIAATEVPYKCQFKWPLAGAYLGFVINMARGSDSALTCAIISALFLKWKVKWNERYVSGQKSKKGLTKRMVRHTIMGGLIVGLFVLFMWNHATLDVEGKKVSLKESVKGFVNSQEFSKVAEAFTIVWNYYKAHGFIKLKNHLLYGFDPEVIDNAYKVSNSNL